MEPGLVVKTHLDREHGYAAARELLSRPDRPTAVFTANGMQALGVYRAARELVLGSPDDLCVVGFDDVPAVAWMDPPLTTVHQPLAEMATAATELALALGVVRMCRSSAWRSRRRSRSGRARLRPERDDGGARPRAGRHGVCCASPSRFDLRIVRR
ncbi:substrate-binding domain-containing protein [Streptomyces coeruleoprunus]|uniref:Substrate-binding domain-containing protein n=1 Tax=Streptomyces coeruleoprunus TaxID=285563 RepID=A0ABV9XDB6_9ACTN